MEVGCERFFGLSGYVSQPRRSMLGVRNYERLAMLATMLQSLFIDPNWVAEEYLHRAKAGKWKKEHTVESFKCFNLERILDAQMYGKKELERLIQEEYVKLGEGMEHDDDSIVADD